jgi:hypothetical protein
VKIQAKLRAGHALARALLDLPVPERVAVLKLVVLPWLREKWGIAETE